MKTCPCPTCLKPMEERFTRSRDPQRPATVNQCQTCWGVFITERGQQELGIAASLHELSAAETTGRRCPSCEREMKVLSLRAKKTLFGRVELDRCPACSGLFFDPGELEQALGRVASITATRNDEYLHKDPRRVSSLMSDPRGPWRGDLRRSDADIGDLLSHLLDK